MADPLTFKEFVCIGLGFLLGLIGAVFLEAILDRVKESDNDKKPPFCGKEGLA